jgi:nucleoside-diphosphate-sugar epimerase
MQTILGANGQIATELAKELKRSWTSAIRLVSRSPKKVNDTDELFAANLLDPVATSQAVKGSSIAYLTVGLPADTKLWQEQFPVFMENTINACARHNAKLVFFDNTYMYPQNNIPLTEETPFDPVGEKGIVRAAIAQALLHAINIQKIEAVICRAPEFYGPDKTKGITNTLIFEKIASGKKPIVPIRDDKLRTLIWSPDASKATALIGNTPDAYNQTWHLPCDDNRLTYKQFITLISKTTGKEVEYEVANKHSFEEGSSFSSQWKELLELLPRYEDDNLFISGKFKKRFPEFSVTSYEEGIKTILNQIL